jgi:hypothetical protein
VPFTTKITGQKKHFFIIFFFTYVWNSVKISVCLQDGKRKPPAGDGCSGEPRESGKPPKS